MSHNKDKNEGISLLRRWSYLHDRATAVFYIFGTELLHQPRMMVIYIESVELLGSLIYSKSLIIAITILPSFHLVEVGHTIKIYISNTKRAAIGLDLRVLILDAIPNSSFLTTLTAPNSVANVRNDEAQHIGLQGYDKGCAAVSGECDLEHLIRSIVVCDINEARQARPGTVQQLGAGFFNFQFGSTAHVHIIIQTQVCQQGASDFSILCDASRIAFGDHPLKFERYRED